MGAGVEAEQLKGAAVANELIVKIGADLSDLQKKMTAAQKVVSDFGQQMEKVGKRLTIGVTAPLVGLGALAVRSATQLDSLTRGLTAVAGSSKEAEKQLSRLSEVAKLPGLGFREAIQGSIRLQAAGFSAALAEDALRGFGNALASVGGGKADLDAVTRALSQMASKGKISAEEINQIAEVVPQIRVAMQAAFGTSNTELLQKSGIEASEFVRRVTDELLKLEQVTGGPANAFENLSDAMFRASAAIGEKLLPAIVPLVQGLAAILERVRGLSPETVKWGLALAGVAALAGPLLVLVGVMTKLSAAVSAFLALKTAATIAAMTTGVGLAVVALGGLAALFLKNKLEAVEAAGAVDAYTASLGSLNESMARFKLGDIQDELAKTRAELERIEAIGDIGVSTDPGEQTAIEKRAAPLRAQIATLEEQFRIVTRRLTDLRTEAGSALETVATSTNTAAEAAEKLAGAYRSAKIEADRLASSKDALGGVKERAAFVPNVTGGAPTGDIVQVARRAPTPDAGGGGFLSKIGSQVGSQVMGVVAQFGPLAAVAAALRPVFQGLMDTLGPALSALAKPLRSIGELIGSILVPVLEVLAEPLELVANLVKLLIEPLRGTIQIIILFVTPGLKILGAVLKVVTFLFSYVVQGIGIFVEALGRFVDKIVPDWLSKAGKSLAKAGQEMQDNAEKMRHPAEDTADSVGDLGNAAEKATASLVNYARVQHINALRFGIAGGMTGGVGGGGSTGGAGGTTRPDGRKPLDPSRPGGAGRDRPSLNVTINNRADGGADVLVESAGKQVQKTVSRGGTSRFALAT